MSSGAGCIACCFLSLVILGLVGTANYVKIRNMPHLYMNTTCLLVNRTCIEQQCQACWRSREAGEVRCTNYSCWNEYLLLSYSIWDGTEITNVRTRDRVLQCDQKMEVRSSLYYWKF
jgi:hypothetical protein